MADVAFGGFDEVEEADANADLLDHFVRILGVDAVFDGLGTGFAKFFGLDLY